MNIAPKKLKKGAFKVLNVKSKDVKNGKVSLPSKIILHSKKELSDGVYRFKYKGLKIKGVTTSYMSYVKI